MASVLLYVALILLTVVLFLRSYLNKKHSYFKNKGIAQLKTEFIFGNAREVLQKKEYQAGLFRKFYNEFKKMGVKHGGVYLGTRPEWVPIDPELIKTIIIKDFLHFSAHIKKFSDEDFFKNLFLLDGEEWKDMRKKLTPTFTSGKMKMMCHILLEKTSGLSNLVEEMCKTGEPGDIKRILARFTTDVVGNCGFGIECNSIEDEDSEFFRKGQQIFAEAPDPPLFKTLLIFLGLMKIQPPVDIKPIENFFRNMVKDTIEYREKNKVIRKDFLHLMIQLKNKGIITELTHDNEDIFVKTVDHEVMSLNEITGQCLLFFNAGFETSSTTMSFALLELTQNQDVQDKLRKEVREVFKKHDGKLSYDALQEMTYCDDVIHETLRKYPPVGALPRSCTKTYTIPGTDITIEKGTPVTIPVLGLQMDPDYFPDPEKFIPERFNAENKSKIKDFTYLPFGEGPRMCLGLRFGIMQSKAGLATLIKSYRFTLNEKTPFPPPFKKAFRPLSIVEGGIWVNASRVE